MEPIKVNLSTFEHYDMRLANLMCISIVIFVLLFSTYNIHLYFRSQDEIRNYEEKIETMELRFNKIRQMKDERMVKIGQNELNSIRTKASFVNRLIAFDIFPWHRVLNELERIMPGDMILRDFSPSGDFSKITLRGSTGSTQSISLFLNKLNSIELFHNNVLLGFNVKHNALTSGTKEETIGLKFEIESQLHIDKLFLENGYGDLGKILLK